MNDLDKKRLQGSYHGHMSNSGTREIEFKFSYKEWLEVWSGLDENGEPFWKRMGNKPEDLVMSRYGDIGPYEPGNVFIQTNKENLRQSAEKRSNSHLRKTWWFGYRDGENLDRWLREIDYESDSNQWIKITSKERNEIGCCLHDRNKVRRGETCDKPEIECVCSDYGRERLSVKKIKKLPWE